MTKTTVIALKLIAFTAIILGVAVLAVCGWTLSNTFLRLNPELDDKERNSTVWSELEEDLEEDSNERMWDVMSDDFRVLIQGCTAASIACALVQLMISVILLCTSSRKVMGKARLWQWIHFNIILLLLICILVPLSYNREKDSFRGSSSFAKYMKNEFMGLYDRVIQNDGHFIQFFFNDLNSYYIILGIDAIFLLILFFLSCCFTRCRCSDDYQIVG